MTHLTLTALADARGLVPAYLRNLGWQERPDGVAIPWPLEGGGVAWHIRHRLERDGPPPGPRWTWQHFDRTRLLPYGADRLPRMQSPAPAPLVIVESEVDAVCLWAAGLAALATAGADGWQARWWTLAEGFGAVVLWLEDGGSLPLLRRLAETRPDDAPPLHICHALDAAAKDAGRLLATLNGSGRETLRRIVARAVKVSAMAGSEADLLRHAVARLHARPSGAGYTARCPFHADTSPSLSLFQGEDGAWAFRCHAGSCGVRGPLSLLGATLGIVPPGPGPTLRADAAPVRRGARPHEADATDSTDIRPGPADELNSASVAAFRFRPPAALLSATPEQTPWLWQGYLARGALTVLGAREKAGKSTLTWALIAALLSGRDFCGQPTAQTPVVALTEESPATVAEKLERFGIAPDALLSILTRGDVRGRPDWETVVAAAGAEARRLGAGLIVIDTLAYWAALPPDAENSAGAMTAALRPLLELAGWGPGVLAVHHANKADGELRGSTAIGATADIIVTLAREAEAPTRRRLEVIGRFSECPVEPVVIELSGDGYVALGAPRAVAAEAREQQVLGAVPSAPPGLTQREVAEVTGLPLQRVAEALAGLVARGAVVRAGQGTRGAPYRYWRTSGPGPSAGLGQNGALPARDGDAADSSVMKPGLADESNRAARAGSAGRERADEDAADASVSSVPSPGPADESNRGPAHAGGSPGAPGTEFVLSAAPGLRADESDESDGSTGRPAADGAHPGPGPGPCPTCPTCQGPLSGDVCWRCKDRRCRCCGQGTGSPLRALCYLCGVREDSRVREQERQRDHDHGGNGGNP